MQTTSVVDWKTLQPLLAENVALKRRILNLCELPLHQIARKSTRKEITILFQTGCITDRILLESGSCYFSGGAAQFLMTLLKLKVVPHDAKLLVFFVGRPPVLKPIFYELKETLDYLCSYKLVNPDVADSDGCPVLLESWREDEHFYLLRQQKLLSLGATVLGTTREGENILHLVVRGKFPFLLNILKYYPKREHLRTLVSRADREGYQPIHRLHTSVQPDITISTFLVELGADVNARISPRGITLLHLFVTNSIHMWEFVFTPLISKLKIKTDFTGISALDLALHHGKNATVQFLMNNLCVSVKDVMSRHVIVMPRSTQLSQFDPRTHRAALLIRTKHGLASNEIQLPENLYAFRPDTIVDRGLKLTMDNVKVFSDPTSPWFLEFYTTQMESLLINFVNIALDPATLNYFLHCYLDALNSDFNIREKHKSCDFNFQLSKHLTRIVRAIGHLRTVGSVDEFMEKFFLFLSKKLLPLIDHKLKPWDINAVREGYISHFIQDVIFQINLVFSIWYFQMNTSSERENAKDLIESVWCSLRKSPNVELSLLGNCVAAIVAWRVMICSEIKLDTNSVLHFFKEMGTDVNERSGPDNLTPLAWIVTYDCGKKFSRNLLKELYRLGAYIYACNRQGLDVITIAAFKNPVPFYREWGEHHKQTPKPLKTICAQCIVAHQIPLQSLSKSKHIMKFIRLHDLSDHNLFVFKSGQICVSERQEFYL